MKTVVRNTILFISLVILSVIVLDQFAKINTFPLLLECPNACPAVGQCEEIAVPCTLAENGYFNSLFVIPILISLSMTTLLHFIISKFK